MRILNVDMTLAPIEGGGTTERTFQMSRALARQKLECSILTTDFGITDHRLEALKGINIITLKCINRRFFIPNLSINKLFSTVKNCDIIHLMGHWTIINLFVYVCAKYYKKPYVICPAGSLIVYGRSNILKRIYNILIGQRILKDAAHLIAITKDEISQLKSYGINGKYISLIPNGINPKDYDEKDDIKFRNKYKLGENPFILFFGGLRAIKGPDLLLKAFNNIKDIFKNYNLVFAGNDRGSLNNLKSLVEHFKLGERVHFIGYVDDHWKSRAFHAADLLVIPSRHEAMSIVVLESGITSTPVLATDRCGLNEISIVGGGMIVSASVEAIERGLREILAEPKQLKEMGKRLHKYVYENFIWDVLISRYLDLYNSILNAKF